MIKTKKDFNMKLVIERKFKIGIAVSLLCSVLLAAFQNASPAPDLKVLFGIINRQTMTGSEFELLLAQAKSPVSQPIATVAKSRLLWQHLTNNAVGYWAMNGVNPASIVDAFQNTGSATNIGWRLITSYDLNGDSQLDLVWQNQTSGEVVYGLYNGLVLTKAGPFPGAGAGANPGWSVIGAADFNGDGRQDLLWQNRNTNEVAYWLMNGLTRISAVSVQRAGAGSNPGWRVVAAADLNGDKKADLIWQNRSTNAVNYWMLNGNGQVLALGTMPSCGPSSNLGWDLVGLSDVNQDSKPDLIWQNRQNSTVAYWLLNGVSPTATGTISGAGPGQVLGWRAVVYAN